MREKSNPGLKNSSVEFLSFTIFYPQKFKKLKLDEKDSLVLRFPQVILNEKGFSNGSEVKMFFNLGVRLPINLHIRIDEKVKSFTLLRWG